MYQGFARNIVEQWVIDQKIEFVEHYSNKAKVEIESSIKDTVTYVEFVENKVQEISIANAFEIAVKDKVNTVPD